MGSQGQWLELALVAGAMYMHGLLLRGMARPVTKYLLFLGLSFWTTVSLSSAVADQIRLFEWLPLAPEVRATGFLGALLEPFYVGAVWLSRVSTKVSPQRRVFLKQAAALSVTAPLTGALYGFAITKRDAQIRELTIPVDHLPPDLEGLKIVQISDIHLSPFYSRNQLARVVAQANDLSPHLAAITGDLITSCGDPLDDALRELSCLSAEAGVFGCMGNHEILAKAEDYVEQQGKRLGLQFLRQESRSLRFGSARLNLAGVDYQRKKSPYLAGAQSLCRGGETNLLLSHNPDVFPVAADQGWDVTLAGHTHGGQITVEYLHPSFNPARYFTPYTRGMYHLAGKSLFVSCGLGTVGVPIRIGTEPEIALVRLSKRKTARTATM